ncbi:MAG: hypothetical protein AAF500_14885 [Myxococcota bacterium]
MTLCLGVAIGCGGQTGPDEGVGIQAKNLEQDFEVDPKGTYLRAILDFGARQPTVIPLADIGAFGGDTLLLRRKGSFKTRFRRTANAMGGVFSASDVVLPNPGLFGSRDRVPDAIDAGENVESPRSFVFHVPTDIQEDFEIGDATEIKVPQGATHLIVAALDPYYSNNKDKGFSVGVKVVDDGTDLCEDVVCEDDGNVCTTADCNPLNGLCETSNVPTGTSCDFGGLPGVCDGGVCQDAMLCDAVDCTDDNACTEGACNPLSGACEFANVADGTDCNFGDMPGVCEGGLCQDAMLCDAVNCDDDNQCTSDVCDPQNGQCGFTNVADGTDCNLDGALGICTGGVCEAADLCEGIPCDDSNACTDDSCNPLNGVCVNDAVTDGTACDFGGLPGICQGGLCQDANLCSGIDCGDGNQCTDDACDPLNGACVNLNVLDGTACNFNGLPGICQGGLCQDADLCGPVDCNDDNQCTSDACDPQNGACNNTNVTDGTTCNLEGLPGICQGGLCQDANLCGGVDCDDDNQCTDDTCDPQNGSCGSAAVADGTSCNFGGLPGVCGGGVCQDAMLCADVNCDDANACTEDACNPLNGVCDNTDVLDGTSCNFNGLPGVCASGTCEDANLCGGIDCDDNNACTSDACDPQNGSCGSTSVPDGTTCNFNGLPGLCQSGTCEDANLCGPVDCNDNNTCTTDICDPQDGSCGNDPVPNGTGCNFGGLPGICNNGTCDDAMLCSGINCDDANECTADACDPQDGLCDNVPVPDGTSCQGNGTCNNGTCEVPVDPPAQIVPQDITCAIVGNEATVPVSLSVDPDTEFTPGGSSTVTTVLTFTIPEGVGQFLLDLGIFGDEVEVVAATLDVTVSGGTPTPVVLTRADLAENPLIIDVDENDDGVAEPKPFVTDIDVSAITNDGSSSVEFEVSALDVTLVVGFATIQLNADNCTIGAPVTSISFPAN